jgi:hypothetical protein
VDFNYWDLGHQAVGTVVRVALEGNSANVKLLDASNYRAYQAGREHRYYGGYYDRSPVVLKVPSSDHWYVTIDYGGLAGSGWAAVEVLSA